MTRKRAEGEHDLNRNLSKSREVQVNETARRTAAIKTKNVSTPLKDFQYTHCRHCSSSQPCDPNSLSMLACILVAMLQARAFRYKTYNERGW